MSVQPPPVLVPDVPPQDEALRERKSRALWALTVSIFILLLALVSFNPDKEEAPEGLTFQKEASSVRSSMHAYLLPAQLADRLGSKQLAAMGGKPEFDGVEEKIKPSVVNDVNAAMLQLFIDQEETGKPDQNIIKFLSGTNSPDALAAAQVYSSAKVSQKDLQAILKALDNTNAVQELVAYHAKVKAGDKTARDLTFPAERMIPFMAAVFVLLGMLGLGVIVWLVFGLREVRSFPKDHPLQPVDKLKGAYFPLAFLAIFFAFQLVIGFMGALDGKANIGDPMVAVGEILVIAMLIVGLSFFKLGDQSYLKRLNASGASFWANLKWGIGGFLANLPVLGILLLILAPLMRRMEANHPITEAFSEAPSFALVFTVWVMAGFGAPILEEIGFRGLLLRGLMTRMSPLIGSLVCSFLFASVHPQGPSTWLILGWVGFMGCWLTLRTRSIWPAVWMHAFHNTTLVILGFLSQSIT